jgi:hypothetical protein
MTDWPESVREYEKATQYISREPAYDPGMVADIADAAIRDLKAMYEYEYGTLVPKELYEAQAQRAEQAEAEARKWEWMAKQASRGRRTPDGPLLDTLLARYEEEGHWTA